MKIHVVQKGETLFSIAQQYGVSARLLQKLNQVPTDGTLVPGQTLVVLLPERTHVVRRGDTVWSIAREHGISTRELYQNNIFLQGQGALIPGEELILSLQDVHREGSLGVNGYAYPFINGDLLRQVLPYMTYATPFTYGIGADGGLVALRDEGILAAAGQYSVLPWMHLSTITEEGRFSSARAEALLGSVPRQETLLGQIKEILKEKGYGGLDVDFEYIRPELGAAYAAFVDRLRRELNPLGCSVLVALAPKTIAGQRGLLYEAHDYAALGRAANGVLLMTYEWGYTAGPPMAVAPLDKVRQVVDYALTEIPAEKLFLGVPVYGYDWPLPFREGVTRGESISPQEALALARRHGAEIRYDETAQAPWFRYTAVGGREHEVWFEDARSSYAKFRLAAEKGLQGVGLWNLMRPAPQTYLALHGGFEIEVMR
ncbi:MAG: LysM peptidoglycan-binding domain-containing protein [Clostridiales bacterium]|nr:LysM peptidoglycan-binding domain-containing protein [Clostridiales bacterium]